MWQQRSFRLHDAGKMLDRTLAQTGAPPRPVRLQPIVWTKQRPSADAVRAG
jgi:hypothetical protein